MCGNSRTNDPQVGFHCFPSDHKNPERRALWLSVFGKTENDVTSNSRVCSRHFPSGNVKLSPVSTLSKRFASPIKKGVRAKRARHRQELRKTKNRTPAVTSRAIFQRLCATGLLSFVLMSKISHNLRVHVRTYVRTHVFWSVEPWHKESEQQLRRVHNIRNVLRRIVKKHLSSIPVSCSDVSQRAVASGSQYTT